MRLSAFPLTNWMSSPKINWVKSILMSRIFRRSGKHGGTGREIWVAMFNGRPGAAVVGDNNQALEINEIMVPKSPVNVVLVVSAGAN